ncbi:MAG TPA: IclR family transcriptional regulator C-terminal domain-containing protein [Ramlibacter sp.]|nr:IclR family transcriptional regulator C-terminal domain-containing protein [Ramlibacter sp.]
MENRDFVQSLERGLAILRTFDVDNPVMSLSEAAARTGMTRAAARRFLLTLVELQLVGTDGKRFWLRPTVLDLGYRYLAGQPWWHVAQPIVEELARATNESFSVCVLDGPDIVYVCRAAVSRIVSANVTIGSRLPAYCTALGRAALSLLPDAEVRSLLQASRIEQMTPSTVTDKAQLLALVAEVRANGYSLLEQELDLALRALAVPLPLPSQTVHAAVGVSVQAGRISTEELLRQHLPQLAEAARRIAEGVAEAQRTKALRAIPR